MLEFSSLAYAPLQPMDDDQLLRLGFIFDVFGLQSWFKCVFFLVCWTLQICHIKMFQAKIRREVLRFFLNPPWTCGLPVPGVCLLHLKQDFYICWQLLPQLIHIWRVGSFPFTPTLQAYPACETGTIQCLVCSFA